MITTNWTDVMDDLLCEAIVAGRVRGAVNGAPNETFESGLAHIFFYGDTVYKLYKTHADKDHFIKGVLAPTGRRIDFLRHDFTLNQHFSDSVYRTLHSVWYEGGFARVGEFDPTSTYAFVEMSRLDFDQNLHERLLRGDITDVELEELGYETARAVDTCPIRPPEGVSWYDLAKGRVALLRQFVAWLPEEFGRPISEARVIEALEAHLEKHRTEYLGLTGDQLTVNVDNHDENVFFVGGKPQFIDLLPPMETWWYGVPHANLSNLMANVEVLHSDAAATRLKDGYLRYFEITELPAHSFGFTHAFAYLISIAHFGSVPGKEEVARGYLKRVPEIGEWLERG
jgi:hypothetical protein